MISMERVGHLLATSLAAVKPLDVVTFDYNHPVSNTQMPRWVCVLGVFDDKLHGLALENLDDDQFDTLVANMTVPPDPRQIYSVNKSLITLNDCYRTFNRAGIRTLKRAQFAYLYGRTVWLGTTPRATGDDQTVGTLYFNGNWNSLLLGAPPVGKSLVEQYLTRKVPGSKYTGSQILETAHVLARRQRVYADPTTLDMGGRRLLNAIGLKPGQIYSPEPKKYVASGPGSLYAVASRIWGGSSAAAHEYFGEYNKNIFIRDVIARKLRLAAKLDELLELAGMSEMAKKTYVKTNFEAFWRSGNKQIVTGGPLGQIMRVRSRERYVHLLGLAKANPGVFLVRPDLIGRLTVEKEYPSDILPR